MEALPQNSASIEGKLRLSSFQRDQVQLHSFLDSEEMAIQSLVHREFKLLSILLDFLPIGYAAQLQLFQVLEWSGWHQWAALGSVLVLEILFIEQTPITLCKPQLTLVLNTCLLLLLLFIPLSILNNILSWRIFVPVFYIKQAIQISMNIVRHSKRLVNSTSDNWRTPQISSLLPSLWWASFLPIFIWIILKARICTSQISCLSYMEY